MDPASISALISGGSSLLGGLTSMFGGDDGSSAINKALKQADAQYQDTKDTNRAIAGQQLALNDPLYQSGMKAYNAYLQQLGLPYITSDLVGSNIQSQGNNYVGMRPDGSTFFASSLPQMPGGATSGGQGQTTANLFGVTQPGGSNGGASSVQGWNPNAAMGTPVGTADGITYYRRDQNSLMPYTWSQGTGFQQTPGYQFAFNQGVQALDRSAAANGRLDSGAQAKELTQYGQGIANQEYNNWLSKVGAVAGMAPTSTSSQSSIYGNLGTNSATNNTANANLALTGGATQYDMAQRSQSSFNSGLSSITKGLGSLSSLFPTSGV